MPFQTSGNRVVLSRALVAVAAVLALAGIWDVTAAPPANAKEPAGTFEYGCRVQPPQRFLERRVFVKHGAVDPKRHVRALRYLVSQYGNTGDESTMAENSDAAARHAKTVRFFGLPVSVHEKIAPALACVEKRIKKNCTGRSRYTPQAVGGLRTANTYRGPEVSNHLFGIALDIDPEKNPCCGCVDPWPNSPICLRPRDPGSSAYDRTALPKCWIRAFQHFGFDWLGHDELEDTMHFEFLGDPERIKK